MRILVFYIYYVTFTQNLLLLAPYPTTTKFLANLLAKITGRKSFEMGCRVSAGVWSFEEVPDGS